MKKTLALLMALTLLLCLSAPLYALADGSITLPDNAAPVGSYELQGEVEIETARSAPIDVDPGGIDFTPLFQALIGALALIVTTYLIPWIKSKTTAAQRDRIDYWTRIAVAAAEQAYGSGNGNKKLADASAFLAGKGIIIDPTIVDAIIQEFFENAKGAHSEAEKKT